MKSVIERITRRYSFELYNRNSLGPNSYVPSTDYGTSSNEMSWIFDTYKALSNSDLESAGSVTSKHISQGGIRGRTEATGRGVYIGVRELMENKEEMKSILHVIAIYCGVPQGVECFRIARKVLEEAGEI